MADLANMPAAGCLSLSTPSGSSGICTGARRSLFVASVSRKASATETFGDGSWVGVGVEVDSSGFGVWVGFNLGFGMNDGCGGR